MNKSGSHSPTEAKSYQTFSYVKQPDQRELDAIEMMKKLKSSKNKSELLYFKNQLSLKAHDGRNVFLFKGLKRQETASQQNLDVFSAIDFDYRNSEKVQKQIKKEILNEKTNSLYNYKKEKEKEWVKA